MFIFLIEAHTILCNDIKAPKTIFKFLIAF